MAAGVTACTAREEWKREAQRTDIAMGTIVRQNIYLTGEKDVTNGQEVQIVADIIGLITDLEEELLSHRLETSEIYRLNRQAGQKTEISPELARILEEAGKVSEASEGAFDITIGKVTELWDIDKWSTAEETTDYRIPEEEELERALADSGYEKILLEGAWITLPTGMKLDLGAVGKGIACDKAAEYLESREDVIGAVLSVGGSILVYGSKPDGSPWKVGVMHPREEGQYLGSLQLLGTWYVSTSGDYERYVEVEGVRYHHILDPADGYPADSGVVSVTILSESGLLSDALSTACFVLGVEKGLELAEAFQAQALIVDEQGGLHMTEGMYSYFEFSEAAVFAAPKSLYCEPPKTI